MDKDTALELAAAMRELAKAINKIASHQGGGGRCGIQMFFPGAGAYGLLEKRIL